MRSILSALMLLILSAAAFSQAASLDSLVGTWQGNGKVNGRQSEVTMVWRSIAGGKHYRLEFKNKMEGGILFEGNALYSPGEEGSFTGLWVDSLGSARPIGASFNEGTLLALWGTAETEEGRTEYKLTGPDTMTVTDSVKVKDGWREFGSVAYKRVGGQENAVRKFTAAYNARDLDSMMGLVRDDVRWQRINPEKMEVVTDGKKALRESLVPYFKDGPSTNSKIESLMTSGRFVVVTERVFWKDDEGADRSQAAVIVYEFNDELIRNIWDFPAYP
ncbi:MAG: DUF1579 domain-containing protein [Acidobacteria bacterium]|nr:MAG: DUF1579 domain-containing protein [Acidobacteriota bacterium]REJ98112.1 MAG: DUF1579 domain-containing protein [Acidobacteriota bacterium]REK16855.1 MAG: DUF1579 domain-containing protein [Acidobacteriota bacterium]REK42766.1 MAG: DUF1579 domain-containing protein [Acidobacteriota bacterium]